LTNKTSTWYSQQHLSISLSLLSIIIFLISFLIPPLQSPDEPNHLKRAYLLANGKIFLDAKDGVTGGEIDRGLVEFENYFSYLRVNTLTRVNVFELTESTNIPWHHKDVFSGLPNTAIYFPLSYIPQTFALLVGESINLSVGSSYYLSRIFCLLFAMAIIYLASIFYPIPPLAFACLVLPMSLFQLGSASLDPFNYAICFLIGALFMRATESREGLKSYGVLLLGIALLAFITTRINFIFLSLIPLRIYFLHKKSLSAYISLLLAIFALSWILYTLKYVQGMPVLGELSTTEIIYYYLKDPWELIKAFFVTLTKWGLLRGYWEQFVGKLGWLDAPIPDFGGVVYAIYFSIFVYLAYLTRPRFNKLIKNRNVMFFLICLGFSWVALFAILLFTWTKHPAGWIDGVQGRYFIPFVIFVAYSAFNGENNPYLIKRVKVSLLILLIMSIPLTLLALYLRYWN